MICTLSILFRLSTDDQISSWHWVPCKDATTINTFNTNGFCAFTAVYWHYIFLANSAWFCVVSVNILLTLFQFSWWAKHLKAFRVCCYCVGYLGPVIPTIIGIAARKYVGGDVTCLVDASKANGWWMDGLFFVWLGIWVCVAILSMVIIAVHIIVKMGWSTMGKQQRLLLYCAIFGYIAVYTICFSRVIMYYILKPVFPTPFLGIYTRAKTDAVKKSLIAYATCAVQGGIDCKPGTRFNAPGNRVNIIHSVTRCNCSLVKKDLT